MFSPSGSLSAISSPITKVSSNIEVTVADDVLSDVDKLSTEPHVNETMSHKTTYNPVTSWTSISSLYAYPQSTPVIVTYYTKNTGRVNKLTADTDFSLAIGITQNYLKIVNFELRIDGDLNFTYDSQNSISTCIGSAFIYPKFDVSIGDVFLYKLDDGVLGLFKLTDKIPLSIHKDTLHRIDFELIKFPTASDLEELETYVDRTAYFFKDTFFNGNLGLVYDETYQLLKLTKSYIEKLLNFYYDKFYNVRHKTFVRPDDIYDPYVVFFLSQCIDYYKLSEYPVILLEDIADNKFNIFYYLINFDKCFKKTIKKFYTTPIKQHTHRDTDITSLINCNYVFVGDDDGITSIRYPFTNILEDDIGTYTTIETLLNTYINERTVQPSLLIDLIDNFDTLSDLNQFYHIPVYIYLLTIIQYSLLR